MKAEQPAGAKPAELEAHKFFCLTALNVSSIVGHTCGVERAGKAYKLVMTSHRKNLEPMRAAKAVFVLSNYGLMHRGVDLGNSLADFSDSMLVEETVAEELQGKRLHALRRGRIITDDELAVDEDEEETGEEALGRRRGRRRWGRSGGRGRGGRGGGHQA